MTEKIVLTGIARSKGKAAGEALVNSQRLGWAFNAVGNEDGIVLQPGADIEGKSVAGKIVIYPTVHGSTSGAASLYFKCTQSHHGPAALICRQVHWIDINGAIASGIPAVDELDQDPIETIKTGDWVEIDAPEVGQKATVTITRKSAAMETTAAPVVKPKAASIITRKTMKLTPYQQEMLDGKHGETKQFCMDKLVDFGKAVEAEEMVPLVLTLNGVPIWAKNRRDPEMAKKLAIYDLGHSALYDPLFEMKDAKVADKECTKCGNDPYMMQLDKYDVKDSGPWNFEIPGKGSFKIDEEIHRAYKDGYEKMAQHGWLNWLSCTPYFNTCIPKMGEYCASSESSAACYINTILGARTNREAAINTIYCAYTGCLPKYGTHLDENRAAHCIIELDNEVRDNLQGVADWAALGACIAEKADNRIMAVVNLPQAMGPTATKQIVSCASPGMNDPMMHLMGYTPESPTLEAAFKGKMPKNPERYKVTMDDVVEMFRRLNNVQPAPGPEGAKPVDIVVMGCPHLTFEEIREIAQLVKGKKVKHGVKLWVQTDTPSYHMAHHYGDAKIIEDAGGKIYHQTCMVMTAPRHFPPGLTVATDSFKYVKLGSGFGQKWIFANPEALINAAVTGVFKPTPRWDYWSQPKEMRQANEKDRPLYDLPGAI